MVAGLCAAGMTVGLQVGRLQAETDPLEQWAALHTHASSLLEHAHIAEARETAKQALALAERAFGKEDLHTARTLQLLGRIYSVNRQDAQALHAYQRALAIFEHALGPARGDVAETVLLIAQVYLVRGDAERAEPLCQRALAIQRATLGPAHPAIAETLILIAKCYVLQGRPAHAEPLYAEALKLAEAAQDTQPAFVAKVLVVVAEWYLAEGRADAAESLGQRALLLQERDFGVPELGTLEFLARLYTATGEVAKAEPFRQRADTLRQRARTVERTAMLSSDGLGEALPHREAGSADLLPPRERQLETLAKSLIERSLLYTSLGEAGEANRLFLQAVGVYEQLYHADRAKIDAAIARHAEELEKAGKRRDAQLLRTRAQELQAIR